MNYPTKESIQM